eukprot:2659292-Rhodomonas_salina.2
MRSSPVRRTRSMYFLASVLYSMTLLTTKLPVMPATRMMASTRPRKRRLCTCARSSDMTWSIQECTVRNTRLRHDADSEPEDCERRAWSSRRSCVSSATEAAVPWTSSDSAFSRSSRACLPSLSTTSQKCE